MTMVSLSDYNGLLVIDSLFPFVAWKYQEKLFQLVILQFSRILKNACSIIATKPSIIIYYYYLIVLPSKSDTTGRGINYMGNTWNNLITKYVDLS